MGWPVSRTVAGGGGPLGPISPAPRTIPSSGGHDRRHGATSPRPPGVAPPLLFLLQHEREPVRFSIVRSTAPRHLQWFARRRFQTAIESQGGMTQPQFDQYRKDLVEAEDLAVTKSAAWLRKASAWPPRWSRLFMRSPNRMPPGRGVSRLPRDVRAARGHHLDLDVGATAVGVLLVGRRAATRILGSRHSNYRPPESPTPSPRRYGLAGSPLHWKYRPPGPQGEHVEAPPVPDNDLLAGDPAIPHELGRTGVQQALATGHACAGHRGAPCPGLRSGHENRTECQSLRPETVDHAPRSRRAGEPPLARHARRRPPDPPREVRSDRDFAAVSRHLPNMARWIFAFLPKVELEGRCPGAGAATWAATDPKGDRVDRSPARRRAPTSFLRPWPAPADYSAASGRTSPSPVVLISVTGWRVAWRWPLGRRPVHQDGLQNIRSRTPSSRTSSRRPTPHLRPRPC